MLLLRREMQPLEYTYAAMTTVQVPLRRFFSLLIALIGRDLCSTMHESRGRGEELRIYIGINTKKRASSSATNPHNIGRQKYAGTYSLDGIIRGVSTSLERRRRATAATVDCYYFLG